MSLFDRFKKDPSPAPAGPSPADKEMRDKLVNLVFDGLRAADGRIRVEDAISASAVIVAERCIDVVGTPALREHDLTPGSRVLSEAINGAICGDELELSKIPERTVVGTLRACLDPKLYPDAEFPDLNEVLRTFLSGIGGDGIEWGYLPLSVGKDHEPLVMPLRVGYETRSIVDNILGPVLGDKVHCLGIATQSLAVILTQVAGAIDHRLALRLAMETVNGMAKTASMTEKAMRAAGEST